MVFFNVLFNQSDRLFAIIHCKSVAYATNAEKMIVNVELKLTVQLSHLSSHTFELLVINLVRRSFQQGLERAEEVRTHIERQILRTEFL